MADGANYWDSVGRPRDKDGRMMDAYFDVNTLAANRQEAERMKKTRGAVYVPRRASRAAVLI